MQIIALVRVRNWIGVYIDGQLKYEDEKITPEELVTWFKDGPLEVTLADLTGYKTVEYYVTTQGGFPYTYAELERYFG